MESATHHRFAELVEPHLVAIERFLRRRDPQLADDVMQEVGIVAWRRLHEMPSGHERAWLFGVARNVLLAERRKANERQSRETDDAASLHAVASPDGLSPLLALPVAEALGRVSERDRDLLLLTAWEGLSTAETAEVLGIRPTAARMGLVRARRRLAAALDDLDPGWDVGRRTATTDDSAPAPDAARTSAPTAQTPNSDHRDPEEATECPAARS